MFAFVFSSRGGIGVLALERVVIGYSLTCSRNVLPSVLYGYFIVILCAYWNRILVDEFFSCIYIGMSVECSVSSNLLRLLPMITSGILIVISVLSLKSWLYCFRSIENRDNK